MITENQWKSKDLTWEGVEVNRNTTIFGKVKVDFHMKATTWGVAAMLKDAKKNGFHSEFWHGGQDWDLDIGADKAIEMASSGWKGKGQYINRLAEKCASMVIDMPTTQIVRDLHGPMWDMAAVISDQPYCALNFREAPAPELIKMVINGFYSGSVDAKSLERRASALAALLLTLHTAGFSVDCSIAMPGVIGGRYGGDGKKKVTYSEVTIYQPGDVFDLERIAYWMGHPAAVRDVLYASENVFEGAGLGNALPHDETVKALKEKAVDEGAIYIESMFSGYYGGDAESISRCATEEGALDWIKEQVSKVKSDYAKTHVTIPDDQH